MKHVAAVAVLCAATAPIGAAFYVLGYPLISGLLALETLALALALGAVRRG